MRMFLALLLLLSYWLSYWPCQNAFAAEPESAGNSSNKSKRYPDGIQAEFGLAKGYTSISNPDGTTAHYNTLAIQGLGHMPLIGGGTSIIGLDLIGSVRYFDLQNSSEISGTEKEVANMIGPGGGVHLRIFRLIGGYQLDYLLARHYAIGPVSRELNYSTVLTRTYYGLQFTFGQLSISFTASNSNGSVPKANSGLSSDSAIKDQTYWLSLNYSTGASFLKFLKQLFY